MNSVNNKVTRQLAIDYKGFVSEQSKRNTVILLSIKTNLMTIIKSILTIIIGIFLLGCSNMKHSDEVPTIDIEAGLKNRGTLQLSELISDVEFIINTFIYYTHRYNKLFIPERKPVT